MLAVDYYHGLLGGLLIGFASLLLLLGNGRIAGISGILGGLLNSMPSSRELWRLIFIIGLMCGGGIVVMSTGESLPVHIQGNNLSLVIAGLLVGFGTRLGSGCTSGHGVCGIGRLSKRSIVATLVFMSSGIVTLYVVRHLLGINPV